MTRNQFLFNSAINQLASLALALKIISDHSYQSESSMGTQIMGWYVMGAQT